MRTHSALRKCPLSPLCKSTSSLYTSRSSYLGRSALVLSHRVLSLQAQSCARNPADPLAVRREPLPAALGGASSPSRGALSAPGTQLPAPRKKKNGLQPSADEIRMAELCPLHMPGAHPLLPSWPCECLARTRADAPYPGSRSRISYRAEKRRRFGARDPS